MAMTETMTETIISGPALEKITSPESPILNLPIEVHIGILQSCSSYTQALALVSTCKQLHSLWGTYATSVVSYIGRNSMPAFDDALLAIRATDQAIAYYNHIIYTTHNLPTASDPPSGRISLAALSPTNRKATISEVRRVLDLKLFVDYSLYLSHGPGALMHLACLIQNSSYLKLDVDCGHRATNEMKVDPENTDLVEARVYSSMYRLFTVSAVLTNIYFEPFFDHNNPISTKLRKAYELFWPRYVGEDPEIAPNHEYWNSIRKLQFEEAEYLLQFECFNKQKMRTSGEGTLGSVFDELAEYFCSAGVRESVFDSTIFTNTTSLSTPTPPPAANDDRTDTAQPLSNLEGAEQQTEPKFSISKAAEIQQIMMLNTCYEVWIRMRERIDILREPVRLTHEKLLYSLNKDSIKLVTIPIVFQAIYGVGDAMMPASLEDFRTHPFGPVPPNLQGTDNYGNNLKHVEVPDVLYQLLQEGYIMDLGPGSDGGRAYFEFGWPEYGFFEWIMGRRFGMKIKWGWEYVDERYNIWVREGKVFTDLAAFRKTIPGVLESSA